MSNLTFLPSTSKVTLTEHTPKRQVFAPMPEAPVQVAPAPIPSAFPNLLAMLVAWARPLAKPVSFAVPVTCTAHLTSHDPLLELPSRYVQDLRLTSLNQWPPNTWLVMSIGVSLLVGPSLKLRGVQASSRQ